MLATWHLPNGPDVMTEGATAKLIDGRIVNLEGALASDALRDDPRGGRHGALCC
jgi:hypothetical protein